MKTSKPSAAATAAALALNEARTRKLSPKRRRELATAAVKARWAKRDAQLAQAQAVTDDEKTRK